MIRISRTEALYTAGLFIFCILALLLPRYDSLQLLVPLTVLAASLGALIYLLRAIGIPSNGAAIEPPTDSSKS
jgi:hypothetical protein